MWLKQVGVWKFSCITCNWCLGILLTIIVHGSRNVWWINWQHLHYHLLIHHCLHLLIKSFSMCLFIATSHYNHTCSLKLTSAIFIQLIALWVVLSNSLYIYIYAYFECYCLSFCYIATVKVCKKVSQKLFLLRHRLSLV